MTNAIILARGGSKGIPGKNIQLLKGTPLIGHTIISALKCKQIDDVWVSTDDDQIAQIAHGFGVKTIKRPDKISGDKSQSEEALKHFADNVKFDRMVFIQPTSPLLKSSDLEAAIKMMDNPIYGYDSVFSGYREHWIPRWTINGRPHQWDIKSRPMRQDKEELFVENGAFYITTREAFEASGLRYSGNIGIYEMPIERSFQIDTLDDLNLIKKLMS